MEGYPEVISSGNRVSKLVLGSGTGTALAPVSSGLEGEGWSERFHKVLPQGKRYPSERFAREADSLSCRVVAGLPSGGWWHPVCEPCYDVTLAQPGRLLVRR